MITTQNIGVMLQLLEANYGSKFYDGVPKENVVKLWASQFKDDDPALVLQGVQNCINTMPYKPTIADIRKRMAQAKMKGQMTAMEAFCEISKAVSRSYDRDSAVKAYNDLPPILRKVVCFPSQLTSWRKVSDESFQTVIMSAIRESYKESAQLEADYYALPGKLQKAEGWRVDNPDQAALPEPEVQKSIDQIVDEANQEAARHRVMTDDMKKKNASKIGNFLSPMTADEKKMYEAKQKARDKWLRDRMK